MDKDGYPEDHELEKIKNWNTLIDGYDSLMEYVRKRWKYSDCGYFSIDNGKYDISTGGWSGNEDIIIALQQNYMFWMFCWEESKRGGHYKFELPTKKAGE